MKTKMFEYFQIYISVALKLIHSCQKKRQKTKSKLPYSSWRNFIWDTTRIYSRTFSILSRATFFIINKTDFASYAYDNTPS